MTAWLRASVTAWLATSAAAVEHVAVAASARLASWLVISETHSVGSIVRERRRVALDEQGTHTREVARSGPWPAARASSTPSRRSSAASTGPGELGRRGLRAVGADDARGSAPWLVSTAMPSISSTTRLSAVCRDLAVGRDVRGELAVLEAVGDLLDQRDLALDDLRVVALQQCALRVDVRERADRGKQRVVRRSARLGTA